MYGTIKRVCERVRDVISGDCGYAVARPADRVSGLFEPLEVRQLLSSTFLVTTVADVVDPNDGVMSLREAIEAAYVEPGDDVIEFDAALTAGGPAVITLDENLGHLVVDTQVRIGGPGADMLTIRRDDQLAQKFCIIKVTDQASLHLDGVTITGGEGSYGGGIESKGDLTILNSVITDNRATWGGGIHCSGELFIDHSLISDNYAYSIEIGQRYFTYALAKAGGIHTTGPLCISNSTISGNRVTASASCPYGAKSDAFGGGLYVQGPAEIINTTITDNDAREGGGGIYTGDPANSVKLFNSIVAGNTSVTGDLEGDFDVDSAHNLIGTIDYATGITETNGNQFGVLVDPLDARLYPLALNGGTIRSHALMADSPAIDAGDNSRAVDTDGRPLLWDQREGVRILDGHGNGQVTVDIGSVEYRETDNWFGCDIGEVGAAGRHVWDGDVLNIEAAGEDIWATDDEFYYVNQSAVGDIDMVVRLADYQNNHEWSKSGLMIRASLDTDSAHAFICLTGSNSVAFQSRHVQGGDTLHEGAPGQTPQWLKLSRVGDMLTGYVSDDGDHWSEVGTVQIEMSDEVYAGIATTSHIDSAYCEVEYDSISFSDNLIRMMVDDTDGMVGYEGNWTAHSGPGWEGRHNMTTHETNEQGAAAEFIFSGATLILIGDKQPWGGTADIYIDDVLQKTVSFYATEENQNHQSVIFTIDGLDEGAHTFRMVNSSTDPEQQWIYVDAIKVNAPVPDAPVQVTAQPIGNAVKLIWSDYQDPVVAGYNVYRTQVDDGTYELIAAGGTNAFYWDPDVVAGEAYLYVVTSVGWMGHESVQSQVVAASAGGYYLVSTLTDEVDGDYTTGDLSLREALQLAALEGDADQIQFSGALAGSRILLDLGVLVVDSYVDIVGPGADAMVLDAQNQSGVLHINPDVAAEISGLTLANGAGSGIRNEGVLSVSSCRIESCGVDSGNGGGIYNIGKLEVVDTSIVDNVAHCGGGIYSESDTTIRNCLISGNTTMYYGGSGGGIAGVIGWDHDDDDRTIRLINSTVSGNTCAGAGAGVSIEGMILEMIHSTVCDNTGNGSGISSGSGISNYGLFLGGQLRFYNSIIAGNYNGTIPSDLVYSPSYHLLNVEYSLISALIYDDVPADPGLLYGTSDLPLDPMLADLSDNGGATLTHALLSGSPAKDSGLDQHALDTGLVYDQRGEGYDRFVGTVDMGAYENQSIGVLPPTNLIAAAGDGSVTLTWDASVSPGVLYYKVHRSDDGGGTFEMVAVAFGGTNITGYTVSNDTGYTYYLTAVDSTGAESAASNLVSMTPVETIPEVELTGVREADEFVRLKVDKVYQVGGEDEFNYLGHSPRDLNQPIGAQGSNTPGILSEFKAGERGDLARLVFGKQRVKELVKVKKLMTLKEMFGKRTSGLEI